MHNYPLVWGCKYDTIRIMIVRKIIRHGGVLAVVIPAAWCRDLDWHRGDYVYLESGTAGMVMIQKLEPGEVEARKPKTIQYGKG